MLLLCLYGLLVRITTQRRALLQTVRGDRRVKAPILLLHPPPRDVTPDPRGHVLVDLDHQEEYDAVHHDHAEEHAEVDPLGPPHVDLEHILEDVLSRDLHPWSLPVEHQSLEIVLVLSLENRKKENGGDVLEEFPNGDAGKHEHRVASIGFFKFT